MVTVWTATTGPPEHACPQQNSTRKSLTGIWKRDSWPNTRPLLSRINLFRADQLAGGGLEGPHPQKVAFDNRPLVGEGASDNEGIDSRLCSIQYTSVDKIAKAAQYLGDGILMAKLDVQAAYRLVLVHPDDRSLMGFQRRGALYTDGMLPFGLRSASIIFTAVADALE